MSIKKKLTNLLTIILFLIIGWFLLAFVIVPVISVIKEIFFYEGSFSFHSIEKLVSSPRVKNALTNSYVMAFCTVITVSIVGIFQIMVTEYFDIFGSKFMEIVFMTPLMYGESPLSPDIIMYIRPTVFLQKCFSKYSRI